MMTEYSLSKQFEDLVQKTLTNNSSEQNKLEVHRDKSAKGPDFFQGNNAIKKRKQLHLKPCTTTRIKTRNYLSNISYTSINKEDF